MRALTCVLAVVCLLSGTAQADHREPLRVNAPRHPQRQVIELRLNAQPFPGTIPYRNSWLGNDSLINGRYEALYLIELIPGRSYTLGMACRPPYFQDLAVTLYDRWPSSPGVRRYTLPMGPLVRTKADRLEYRWGIGISPKRTSTLLYLAVEGRPANAEPTFLPHIVFLSSEPPQPASRVGKGITYLQGPQDLVLAGERDQVSYIVTRPEGESAPETTAAVLPLPGDLIQNGWFRDGLNHWNPHRDYVIDQDVSSFSLLTDGLRIYSTTSHAREGVIQYLDADVSDAETLILRADVKVDHQALGGTGPEGRDAPLAITVGYEDARGESHARGGRFFWQGFYMLDPTEPNLDTNGQKVPQGLWYRYIMNLMQLDPKPIKINYISLEGSGWPTREGWIKDVHLIKKTGPE